MSTSEIRRRAQDAFSAEGLIAQEWSNGPGHRYPNHHHEYHKMLFCIEGSITFVTDHGEHVLGPGDRLDLPAGTVHAATVGPKGVRCLESADLMANQ